MSFSLSVRAKLNLNSNGLDVDHDFEPAPEHTLSVERHRLRIHIGRDAGVFHDLGIDAIAVGPRLVHDPRENHRLAGLQFHTLRKRRDLSRLDVVGDALTKLERAVLAPDLSSLASQAAIS